MTRHAATIAGDATVSRTRDAGQTHWVILDLRELPCLMDVSKLNPGPSGEDADAGRSTSRCRITLFGASARWDWSTSGLYLNSPDKSRSAPLARMQRAEKKQERS